MKLDIPSEDHSRLIGRKGEVVNKIMSETQCQIHFPDSNKYKFTQKSNKVSIIGSSFGIEKAKNALRSLLSVVVTFELSAIYCQIPLEPSSPAVKLILQKYKFTATFHQQCERILITARGVQKHFADFRQGLCVLMEYLTGNNDFKLPVTLKTNIDLQSHQAVMGPGSINIEQIKQTCDVNIFFQSTVQSSIPIADSSQNCSGVYISGVFDDVYKAWNLLMGYLPVTLSFNLTEGQDIFSEISKFNGKNVDIRCQKKKDTMTVNLHGIEKDFGYLFYISSQIFNLQFKIIKDTISNNPVLQEFVENSLQQEIWLPKFPMFLWTQKQIFAAINQKNFIPRMNNIRNSGD